MSVYVIVPVLFVLIMAIAWYSQGKAPKKPHGDTAPAPPAKSFAPLEDEFLKNQPPLETLIGDKLDDLPPPPQGKAKKPAPRHGKERS